MQYIFPETKEPVPANIQVYFVPPGISDRYPRGGWFTENGDQVTALKGEAEGVGIAPPQDASKFTVVDLIPELREQLNRIEAKLKSE